MYGHAGGASITRICGSYIASSNVNALSQNAERLRATGRLEEAEEFEIKAQDLDQACDKQWRTRVEQSIVSRLTNPPHVKTFHNATIK